MSAPGRLEKGEVGTSWRRGPSRGRAQGAGCMSCPRKTTESTHVRRLSPACLSVTLLRANAEPSLGACVPLQWGAQSLLPGPCRCSVRLLRSWGSGAAWGSTRAGPCLPAWAQGLEGSVSCPRPCVRIPLWSEGVPGLCGSPPLPQSPVWPLSAHLLLLHMSLV